VKTKTKNNQVRKDTKSARQAATQLTIRQREDAARRRAKKLGLAFEKSRARRDDDPTKGQYRLVEKMVANIGDQAEFTHSLRAVEESLDVEETVRPELA
jgi:hypothetical protein